MLVFMRMLQTLHTEGDDNKQHNTAMNVRLGQLKTDDDMNKSCKVYDRKDNSHLVCFARTGDTCDTQALLNDLALQALLSMCGRRHGQKPHATIAGSVFFMRNVCNVGARWEGEQEVRQIAL